MNILNNNIRLFDIKNVLMKKRKKKKEISRLTNINLGFG